MHPFGTYTPPALPSQREIDEAIALAEKFDLHRDCGWNSLFQICSKSHEGDTFTAYQIPAFASLGGQCHGTLLELALLHTLRPCAHCGNDIIFKGGWMLSCCSCLGDGCDDCAEAHQDEDGQDCGGGCDNIAENMNLPDAITKWNLTIAKQDAPKGLVKVCG